MKTNIYALRENGFVQYVGKTIHSLEWRLSGHLREAVRGVRTHKCCWIRSMLNRGLLPSISLIEAVEGNGNTEERRWIKYFRDHGVVLVNGTEGGEGGRVLPYVRQKISQTLMGHSTYKRTPEICAKISASLTGKKQHRTLEWNAKIGMSNKGKVRSLETRKKLRSANLGRKRSPEVRSLLCIGQQKRRLREKGMTR